MFELFFDFNEISPSKLLGNNIKLKDKFCVVLVHSYHKSAAVKNEEGDTLKYIMQKENTHVVGTAWTSGECTYRKSTDSVYTLQRLNTGIAICIITC
jgi:hypothetical protein